MSEIITDKLTGKTSAGDVTITSEGGAVTMQLQQGVAKAWINFDGTGTIAISDSFLVSSISDGGTGIYTVTSSNAFSNANYATPSMTRNNYIVGKFGTVTTTAIIVENRTNGGSETDSPYVCVAKLGDLA